MNEIQKNNFSKIILSFNSMKQPFNNNVSNIMNDIIKNNKYSDLYKMKSYIKGGHFSIAFINLNEHFYEFDNFVFYRIIHGFTKKYKGKYKGKKHLIGSTLINILNHYKTIISYIENCINFIDDANEIEKTHIYINFLYIQLFLISKKFIYIICDIEKKIDFSEQLKFDEELKNKEMRNSSSFKKIYNHDIRDILKDEIFVLKKVVEKVDNIFSVSSKKGYRSFNSSNIKLPAGVVKYYTPSYGKKQKPYYYKYNIEYLNELLNVTIYQIYISGKVICKCSLNTCNKYFISKKRKDEHFCNDDCRIKYYRQRSVDRNNVNYENQILIKQIKDFLSRPKIKKGIKIKREDRLKELEKFKISLQKKKEICSSIQLNKWLKERKNKYLEKFSLKK